MVEVLGCSLNLLNTQHLNQWGLRINKSRGYKILIDFLFACPSIRNFSIDRFCDQFTKLENVCTLSCQTVNLSATMFSMCKLLLMNAELINNSWRCKHQTFDHRSSRLWPFNPHLTDFQIRIEQIETFQNYANANLVGIRINWTNLGHFKFN